MTLPTWAHALTRDPNPKRLRWFISAVLIASLLAFVVRGADNPADPRLAAAGAPNRQLLPGFEETLITVHSPQGSVLSWCLLLAVTMQQHERGLMQVTDPTLGGYGGMLFRFERTVTGPFWMRNTPMPLSIAYIDTAGQIVSATDMAPCADDPGCPLYPASGPYATAIEVPQGNLARLGIVSGAIVTDERQGCS